jgi:NAD(P)H-flavin reductase
MPKDYQEEIEEISINITSYLAGVLTSGLYDRLENDIIKVLTTYGNARELQGVEKVRKGVPEEVSLFPMADHHMTDQELRDEEMRIFGMNYRRKTVLDHIAKVKSELK